MAEARGKAQADSLRKTKTDALAKRVTSSAKIEQASSSMLRAGDVVICDAGDLIPGDGEVIDGIATVDESVITGESAPVIRESGGDRSAVTGGTRVLSDQIRIKITSNPGETFLDRMIALVEGAQRQKTPNEIALNILIAGLTLIFLLAVVTLQPYSVFAVAQTGAGSVPSVAVLVSLLVCLIPTTIGGLLSAIGIAGMDRVMQHNVLAMSGKAVEAAGDVNSLLLDKTGTITLGNRQAVEFLAVDGVTEEELADAAQLSSLADETPEGRSIVVLAKEKYGLRGREIPEHEATFIPFSAYTRMSGVDFEGRQIRKGATEAIANSSANAAAKSRRTFGDERPHFPYRRHAAGGGRRQPLLGVIHLKDIVKGGMKERIAQLRAHGHPHRDDHRRQSADRRRHRGRSRRGRFPRAGDPERQAGIHQERTGRRTPGRDDRRRHQRRAGAGSSRRRPGDEYRHHGREGSRQHGGSRQQSDEADRDSRDRQAVVDHARRADDVFDRERRGKIFRHHSGDVHADLSGARAS